MKLDLTYWVSQTIHSPESDAARSRIITTLAKTPTNAVVSCAYSNKSSLPRIYQCVSASFAFGLHSNHLVFSSSVAPSSSASSSAISLFRVVALFAVWSVLCCMSRTRPSLRSTSSKVYRSQLSILAAPDSKSSHHRRADYLQHPP